MRTGITSRCLWIGTPRKILASLSFPITVSSEYDTHSSLLSAQIIHSWLKRQKDLADLAEYPGPLYTKSFNFRFFLLAVFLTLALPLPPIRSKWRKRSWDADNALEVAGGGLGWENGRDESSLLLNF